MAGNRHCTQHKFARILRLYCTEIPKNHAHPNNNLLVRRLHDSGLARAPVLRRAHRYSPDSVRVGVTLWKWSNFLAGPVISSVGLPLRRGGRFVHCEDTRCRHDLRAECPLSGGGNSLDEHCWGNYHWPRSCFHHAQ